MWDKSSIELSSHPAVLLWNLNPEDHQAFDHVENILIQESTAKFRQKYVEIKGRTDHGLVVLSGSEILINWCKICYRTFLYQNFFWSASQQNSTGQVQILSFKLASQIFCPVAETLLISGISTSRLQRTLFKIASAFTDRRDSVETKLKATDANICLGLDSLTELKERAWNTTPSTRFRVDKTMKFCGKEKLRNPKYLKNQLYCLRISRCAPKTICKFFPS